MPRDQESYGGEGDSTTYYSGATTSQSSIDTVFPFYDRWNVELSALKDRLDYHLNSMVSLGSAVITPKHRNTAAVGVGPKARQAVTSESPTEHPQTPRQLRDLSLQQQYKHQKNKSNKGHHDGLTRDPSGGAEIRQALSARSGKSFKSRASDRTELKSNLTKHVQERRKNQNNLSPPNSPTVVIEEEDEDSDEDEEGSIQVTISLEIDSPTQIILEIEDGGTNEKEVEKLIPVEMERIFFPEEDSSEDGSEINMQEDEEVVTMQGEAVVPSLVRNNPTPRKKLAAKPLSPSAAPSPCRKPVFDEVNKKHINHGNMLCDLVRDAPCTLTDRDPDSKFYRPDAPGCTHRTTSSSAKDLQTPKEANKIFPCDAPMVNPEENLDDGRLSSQEGSSVQRKMNVSQSFRKHHAKLKNQEPQRDFRAPTGILVSCQRDSRKTSSRQVKGLNLVDPYGDQGRYSGELTSNGKPDGHGTMFYKDGRVYTGSWKCGFWYGHGKASFSNGDLYTGEYVKDQRHGIGRYEWVDGRVYDGRFEHDQRQGNGIYSWSDGSMYAGDFHEGLRHGSGTFTFTNGSIYTGEWKAGMQHGSGECAWSDGRCYRGEWMQGQAHGRGVETRADGSIRHDGLWKMNRPVHQHKLNDKSKLQKCEYPKITASPIASPRKKQIEAKSPLFQQSQNKHIDDDGFEDDTSSEWAVDFRQTSSSSESGNVMSPMAKPAFLEYQQGRRPSRVNKSRNRRKGLRNNAIVWD
jgi:hypothetical protein